MGLYHEKIGVFYDVSPSEGGSRVAFSGSANETRGGLIDNFESIDVYWSWDDEQGRVERKEDQFERLWTGKTQGLEVVPFTDVAAEVLRPYRGSGGERVTEPAPPPVLNKWRHQDEAVKCFLQHERGVLNMATGTGKTRTALRIARDLLDAGEVDTLIVSMPGNDLLDQWHRELLHARDGDPLMSGLLRAYGAHRGVPRFCRRPAGKALLASHANTAGALEGLVADQARRTLLIYDEVHSLGSPRNREQLAGRSDAVRFRLGLSATPEREYDEDGTAFIERHVGPVLFEFGLAEAIEWGILCPFDYYPLEYELTQGDRDRLQGVYAKQAARKREGRPMSKEELWIDLARVYKTSEAKLPLFEAFAKQRPEVLRRCIVFVETMEYGERVMPILHRHHPEFATYYGGEDPAVLERFARGDIECLVTCHKLSQGIDVRSLRNVILFSSSRAQLETIQRVGRCLRTDPSDPDKVATIVDFVRADAPGGVDPAEGDSPASDGAPHVSADTLRRRFFEALAAVRPNP